MPNVIMNGDTFSLVTPSPLMSPTMTPIRSEATMPSQTPPAGPPLDAIR